MNFAPHRLWYKPVTCLQHVFSKRCISTFILIPNAYTIVMNESNQHNENEKSNAIKACCVPAFICIKKCQVVFCLEFVNEKPNIILFQLFKTFANDAHAIIHLLLGNTQWRSQANDVVMGRFSQQTVAHKVEA